MAFLACDEFCGESGLLKAGLGGIHPLTQRYALEENMEIRRINQDDLDSFVALWQGVFDEGAYLRNPPPPKEKVLKVLCKVEQLKFPNFVALSAGKVVASIEAFPGSMCGLECDDVGFVGAQVHADLRGKGLGKKLLKQVISDSKRFGYKELKLEVYKSNIAARKLYEKFGFSYVGEGEEITLPNGEMTQSLKMRLSIAQA
ncbi:GNAT family N-acetyltransferase [Vibrio vulnificus]|uniref:GNAT family N-acetyltransferase n=3 Tax=Vibrio vulnificus TaxID=672 RepID=UPI00358DAEB3